MNISKHLIETIAECVGAASVGGAYRLDFADGSSRQATGAEVLQAAKPAGIEANRSECERRIFTRYPAGRQLSALAGLYDSANVATMTDWIAANIAAENTAADLIELATTVAEVEAVTVAWPA